MVVLNRIYTRTGDKGLTALGDGTRVRKDDARVAAYGTVDELNATLGLARLHAAGDPETALERIQNDLFDLGADLCTPDFENDAAAKHPRLRIVADQVARLEAEIDAMNARPPRRCGASSCPAAARSRHTSTSAAPSAAAPSGTRSTLAQAEAVNPEAVRYLNRLSDWLFVAARVANDGGAGGRALGARGECDRWREEVIGR